MRATLRLKDGEVLSIGGLVRQEQRDSVRKTPILGDIPLLGALFRSSRDTESRTQLLFFLRIHVLDEGKAGEARVHIPGRGMEQLGEETLTPPDMRDPKKEKLRQRKEAEKAAREKAAAEQAGE